MKQRVYYHHTDCGGVVYYGNYLKFLEEARTEFLEGKGISIKELADEGTLFVVARQEIEYKSPAFYGDILNIDTQLTDVSKIRIIFEYEIKNQKGKLISLARTVMACVGSGFKPKPLSEEIRQRLRSLTKLKC